MKPPPDFVLIGAMKAGSTSLHRQLERHPALFLSRPKEPEYFSLRYGEEGAAEAYDALFREAGTRLRGEASTGYTRWPQIAGVPERLARRRPDARLVYVLRHPVERAVSHWQHRMREWRAAGREPLGLTEALTHLPEILDSSRYLRQIQQYLACFPEDQLLVVTLDELLADRRVTLERVQRFLGVAPHPAVGARAIHANRPGDLQARRALKERLARLRRLPGAGLVRWALPESLRRRTQRRLLDSSRLLALQSPPVDALPQVDEAVRRALHESLDSETRALESWLGRPLPSGWVREPRG